MGNETERRHNEIFWASPNRVGQGIATYADLDQSIFEGLETREDVAGDQLAMDSVAASETAMNAVAASIIARSAILRSSHVVDTVWSTEVASEIFWDVAGDIIQESKAGQFEFNSTTSPAGGFALHFNGPGNNASFADYKVWKTEIDLTGVDTLKMQTEAGDGANFGIRIDGNTELTANSHSWTERTIDVSGYSGKLSFEVGMDDGTSFDEWYSIGELQLEK